MTCEGCSGAVTRILTKAEGKLKFYYSCYTVVVYNAMEMN